MNKNAHPHWYEFAKWLCEYEQEKERIRNGKYVQSDTQGKGGNGKGVAQSLPEMSQANERS